MNNKIDIYMQALNAMPRIIKTARSKLAKMHITQLSEKTSVVHQI
jgi:hypothetical protein